jgi:cystathionine gamma-synthase
MAAIYACLRAVDAEHVVFPADVYGGVYELVTREPGRRRMTYELVDYEDLESVKAALGREHALLWLESPSNPMLDVYDIEEMADLAHGAGAALIVDNTLATPLGQQPLLWGADLVIHSISKYLGGHGDVIGGIAATNNPVYADALTFYQQVAGLIPSPMDCWLTARGLRTLAVRFVQQATNALALAQELRRTAGVQRVHYPAFSERGRELYAKGQLRSYCAVVSLELSESISPEGFVESVSLAHPAASLGGVESTVSRPAVMSHRVPASDGIATVGERLIRVSVGLEEVTDLIDDIKCALDLARR